MTECSQPRQFEWKELDRELKRYLPQKKVTEAGRAPTGWLIVGEDIPYQETGIWGGLSAVLVPPSFERDHRFGIGWAGRLLGEVSITYLREGESVSSGLNEEVGGNKLEFFCGATKPPGANQHQVFLAQPFLWFWDAYQVGNEWRYLTLGGEERKLVRFEAGAEGWTVEARAEEVRTFLHTFGMKLLFQFELFKRTDSEPDSEDRYEYSDDWGRFQYQEYPLRGMPGDHFMKSLDGYFYVTGLLGKSKPRMLQWQSDPSEYEDFIIGVSEDGEPVTHTSDPDTLDNHFGRNPSAPHYLTPIYFSRDVLNKYANSPSRYKISTSRIECLNLWGLDISINEHDLVVAYLGDIGTRLPSEEHQHWCIHNVAPEGGIDEGRFRRDILGQWADSPDAVNEIRRKVKRINKITEDRLGFAMWRSPNPHLETELNALIGPLSSDPAALTEPVLTLTKFLVDSINGRAINRSLKGEEIDRNKHLANLSTVLEKNNMPAGWIQTLKDLQRLRSCGGIAHIRNSETAKAFAAMGLKGLDSRDDFKLILFQLNNALDQFLGEGVAEVDQN